MANIVQRFGCVLRDLNLIRGRVESSKVSGSLAGVLMASPGTVQVPL